MTTTHRLWMTGWLVLLFVAHGQGATLDGIAAYVNDEIITVGDVMTGLEPIQRQLSSRLTGEELAAEVQKVYEELLDSMVAQKLIVDAYEKQDQKIPDRVFEERIQRIIHDNFGDDKTLFMAALTRERINYEEWKKQMRERLIVQYMRQSRIDQSVTIPPGAERERYEADRERYRAPSRMHLRLIVLPVKGGDVDAVMASAAALRTNVVTGEAFAEMAAANSADSSAANGGDWGWVEENELRAEFAAAIRSLPVGSVSEPVLVEEAVYLIRVEEREEGQVATFEEIRPRIVEELKDEVAERLYREWVARLKKNAYVKVFKMPLL